MNNISRDYSRYKGSSFTNTRLSIYIALIIILSGYLIYDYCYSQKLKIAFIGLKNYPELIFYNSILNKTQGRKLYSKEELQSIISKLPLVRTCSVEKCNSWSLNCFIVEVKEELPLFMLMSDEQLTIYASNATILWQSRINEHLPVWLVVLTENLPMAKIHNLNIYQDKLEQRVNLITRIIKLFNKTYKLNIETLTFDQGNGFEAKFQGQDFRVIFSFDSGFEHSLLDKQVERLRRVLIELNDKLKDIELINLDFNKIATVKMKDLQLPVK
jgi:hypothetical protein